MPQQNGYEVAGALILGQQFNDRVPYEDQRRQRAEVEQILARFRTGLADRGWSHGEGF